MGGGGGGGEVVELRFGMEEGVGQVGGHGQRKWGVLGRERATLLEVRGEQVLLEDKKEEQCRIIEGRLVTLNRRRMRVVESEE